MVLGMGQFGVVSLCGWGCLYVGTLVQFCKVDLVVVAWGVRQVGGWKMIEIAYNCCSCCDAGESGGKKCGLCR